MTTTFNPNTNITINTATSSPTGSTITITNGGSGYSNWATSSVTTGSTYSWAAQNQNFVSNNGSPLMTVPYDKNEIVLEKAATLDVKGNVKINGVDLEERLKTIEKVLMIPPRDAILEAKYPSLKKKYDEYIKTLEKYTMWEQIKGDEND